MTVLITCLKKKHTQIKLQIVRFPNAPNTAALQSPRIGPDFQRYFVLSLSTDPACEPDPVVVKSPYIYEIQIGHH